MFSWLRKFRKKETKQVLPETNEPANLFQQVESSLPNYLSSAQKGKLLEGLKDFPDHMQYFAQSDEEAALQGDGWSNVDIYVPEIKSEKSTNVLLLSNSCDLSAANFRKIPMRALMAPLFRMSLIEKDLLSRGAKEKDVQDLFKAFKAQQVTNVFYLPKQAGRLEEDCVVFLDAISWQYLSSFCENTEKKKIFSLSQQGAWMLALKLSIHFCRLTDGVVR